MVRLQARLDEGMSYFESILKLAETDPLDAAQLLCEGLMRGDRERLVMGYSIGSALRATLEQIPLSTDQICSLVERVAMPYDGIVNYGPTR
jgi:hypothetical protein